MYELWFRVHEGRVEGGFQVDCVNWKRTADGFGGNFCDSFNAPWIGDEWEEIPSSVTGFYVWWRCRNFACDFFFHYFIWSTIYT